MGDAPGASHDGAFREKAVSLAGLVMLASLPRTEPSRDGFAAGYSPAVEASAEAFARAASSPSVTGLTGNRMRKWPTFAGDEHVSRATSSVTVVPQRRPWHGPIPHRRNALAWFGPVQPPR